MKLRGAISGFGQVAEHGHLAGWRSRPGVEIVAIHEPAAARRQAALRAIKNVRVYEDLELMLTGEAPDFVDIASPPAFHADAARTVLEAGAHVIVEKPLCLASGEFENLVSLAAANHRVLFCVHNWKHSPAYRRAFELVESGKLGDLHYCALTRLRTTHAGGAPWRLDPVIGGGGILIDHGWHVFYLLQWLMGVRAVQSVTARLGWFPEIKVEQTADLTIGFEGSGLGYIHLSWRAPVRRNSAILYGDQGMLEIHDATVRLLSRSGSVEDLSVMDQADDSYHAGWFAALAEEFETALAQPEGSIARQNHREARSALAMLEAAKASHSQRGAPIPVNCKTD